MFIDKGTSKAGKLQAAFLPRGLQIRREGKRGWGGGKKIYRRKRMAEIGRWSGLNASYKKMEGGV